MYVYVVQLVPWLVEDPELCSLSYMRFGLAACDLVQGTCMGEW